MGQRTQIVIEVNKTEKDYKINKEFIKKYVGSYYNQWGLGTMQLRDIKRFLTTYYSGFEEYKLPEQLYKAYKIEDKNDFPFDKECTPENIMDWLNRQDNNNGGLFLTVNMDRLGNIKNGKLYIFNDPEAENSRELDKNPNFEDYVEVNRYVNLWEYINFFPNYFTKDFVTGFLAELSEHNIEIAEPKKED